MHGKKIHVKGQLLVQFKEGTAEQRISEIISEQGASVISAPRGKGPYLLKLKAGEDVKGSAESFSRYKEVYLAEPNYIIRIQGIR